MDAHSIHGTNPQYLVEKIIRTRIYESKYWKEECFGLTGTAGRGGGREGARRGAR
uniref:Pre-mRNA-splicing factor 38B n=1 Tax=Buteo japonicus TaxID=224669 RepID=A0A8C0B2Q9_9AVES